MTGKSLFVIYALELAESARLQIKPPRIDLYPPRLRWSYTLSWYWSLRPLPRTMRLMNPSAFCSKCIPTLPIRLSLIKSKSRLDVLHWASIASKLLPCCDAHIVIFFRFLDVSPMYTTEHFVQSIWHTTASVLLF